MGVYQRGGVWYIDYRYQGERVRERVGPSRKIAENALITRQAEIVQGRFHMAQRSEERFEQFAQEYLEFAKKSKTSWKRDEGILRLHLIPFFGSRKLDEVLPRFIDSYKMKRLDAVSPATVNRELQILKRAFHLAMRWGKASFNPVKDVEFLHEQEYLYRVLSQDETRRLLEACTAQARPFVEAAIHTAMRRGELFHLKWESVDLVQRMITVQHTKTWKVRRIPINDTLLEILRNLKAKKKSEFVFASPKTKGARTDFKVAWRNAVAKAGLGKVRLHDLRHSTASHWIREGMDLATVRDLLGHTSWVTTSRYAHVAPEKKIESVAVLDKLFGRGCVQKSPARAAI